MCCVTHSIQYFYLQFGRWFSIEHTQNGWMRRGWEAPEDRTEWMMPTSAVCSAPAIHRCWKERVISFHSLRTALLSHWGLAPTSFCNHNRLLYSVCDLLLLSPFFLLRRLPCQILPILSFEVSTICLVFSECLLTDSKHSLNLSRWPN